MLSRSRTSGSGPAARPSGLTAEEVEQRRGTAVVRTEGSQTMAVLEELVESVVEPLQLLLVAVGVLSAIFGELRDAIAIFAIIALVSAVEAISEVRAKRALRALRDLSAPNALVRREGAVATVPVDALVIDDVLLVEAGSVVAADARVVEADGLATDESRLTGEPMAAAKGPEPVAPTRRSPSGPHCFTPAAPWWPASARASSSRSAPRPRSAASAGSSRRPASRPRRSSARWPNWRARPSSWR